MMMETEARIYINEQRQQAHLEKGWVKSTLNYGDFQDANKTPFGKLLHVNEWSGYADNPQHIVATEDSNWAILPLATGIDLSVKHAKWRIEVGEMLLIRVSRGDEIEVMASEGAYLFVQLVLDYAQEPCATEIFSLPLAEKNTMNSLVTGESLPFQLYIGAYYTKCESLMEWPVEQNTFSFVLDGCFEVEKRLLFAGDGLALSHTSAMDIECLSATGLLLLVSMPV